VTIDRWLEICRAMRDGVRTAVTTVPRERRADELGRGAGGDTTVAIDQAAEDAAFAVLIDLASATGEGFTVVSEEVGERTLGKGGPWRVVIDPVDGSLNAKRGLPVYAFSVGVADGRSMADVALGYVYDLGNGEEWIARRGGGATVDGVPLGGSRPLERLQLVALEATRPEHLAPAADALTGIAERIRVLGSLALALCHLADGRVDAVASLRPRGARAVDIAAGQLLVREAGSAVALPDVTGPFGAAPLDLEGRSRIVAARDDASLARVAGLLGIGPEAGRSSHPG
jgi:myo-inositol-1(or 4)-monophosphatase